MIGANLTPEQWARLVALYDEVIESVDAQLPDRAPPFCLAPLHELQKQAARCDPVEIEEYAHLNLLELRAFPREAWGRVARSQMRKAAYGREIWEEYVDVRGNRIRINGAEDEQGRGSLVLTIRVLESEIEIRQGSKLRMELVGDVEPLEKELHWDSLGEQWKAQLILTADQRERLADDLMPEIVSPA